MERGLRSITIQDIADAADVSLRTFYRYFRSKEAAIAGPAAEVQGAFRQFVNERAPDAGALELVMGGMRFRSGLLNESSRHTTIQLMQGGPELEVEYLKTWFEIEGDYATAVAERGGGGGSLLDDQLLAALAANLHRAVVEHWHETDAPLGEGLDMACNRLSSGFRDQASAGDVSETNATPFAPEKRPWSKRTRTTIALRSATLKLVMERGLSAVTVQDITQVANVSQRTFYNHFRSKETAIAGRAPGSQEAFVEFILRQPPAFSRLELVKSALRFRLALVRHISASDSLRRKILKVILGDPVLMGEFQHSFRQVEMQFREGLRQREPDSSESLEIRLLAAAATAALRIVMTNWAQTGGHLEEALEAALDRISCGFESGLGLNAQELARVLSQDSQPVRIA